MGPIKLVERNKANVAQAKRLVAASEKLIHNTRNHLTVQQLLIELFYRNLGFRPDQKKRPH
jgi:regulator of sirC expression with transglutaminase-like and TPR domain